MVFNFKKDCTDLVLGGRTKTAALWTFARNLK
jgi:hypothetical protein